MKTIKKSTLTVVAILLVTTSVIAQPNNQNKRGMAESGKCKYAHTRQPKDFCNELELSEDQKSQIDALKLEHQKNMLQSKNQLNEKRAKLQTLETAEPADLKAINKTIDEMAVIKTSMVKQRAEHKQKVRSLLNEEQRIKFDLHASKRGKGHGHRGGNKGNCKNGKI